MKWLAKTLSDDRLCELLEADFCQYYGADLRDFYRRHSGMTYRWVASHIRQLPEDSRWVKFHRRESGQVWDQADHHRQDMVDLLMQIAYYSNVGAQSAYDDNSRRTIHNNAPERILRPGEEREKPQMTSKEDLKVFFSHQ